MASSGPKKARTKSRPIPTAGETVGDEVVLELLRDARDPTRLALLRCDTGWRIAARQKLDGKIYVPPTVDAKTVERLRLPVRTSPYGSTRRLFGEVEKVFKTFGGLADGQASLATYVSFATHFWDCAQLAPCLTFTGSEPFHAAQLLRIFACVTRHALLLSGLGTSLYDLPHGVRPTILLYQPGRSPMVKRLHAASHMRGFPVARQGTVEDLFGPKVMFLGDRNLKGPAADAAISIALSPAPAGTPMLTDGIEMSLSSTFQAKLLQYRIDNFGKVKRSDFDAPQFSGSVRVFARVLGACFAGDRDLQQGVLRSLAGMDEAARASLAMRPESLLVEALLTVCHQDKSVVYVGDVTSLINGILENRGETFKVSARAVGPRVAALGILAKRDGNGYAFRLTNEERRRIHQMALAYSVPSVKSPRKCALCMEYSPAVQ